MTQHRSFKLLVRARMARTGESYTAARAQLLAHRVRSAGEPALAGPAGRAGAAAHLRGHPARAHRAAAGRSGSTCSTTPACTAGRTARCRGTSRSCRASTRWRGPSRSWSRATSAPAAGRRWASTTTASASTSRGRCPPRRTTRCGRSPTRRHAAGGCPTWCWCRAGRPRPGGCTSTSRTAAAACTWRSTPRTTARCTVSVEHARLADAAAADAARAAWRTRLDALRALLEGGAR